MKKVTRYVTEMRQKDMLQVGDLFFVKACKVKGKVVLYVYSASDTSIIKADELTREQIEQKYKKIK